MKVETPCSEMVRRRTVLRSTTNTLWNLAQAICAVSTVVAVGESMHEKSVTNRRDVPWDTLVEVVVGLCRGRNFIVLELVDFLVLTECEL